MSFKCRECGNILPRWAGKCTGGTNGGCGKWNTLDEYQAPKEKKLSKGGTLSQGNVGEMVSFSNQSYLDGNVGENRIKFDSVELNVVLGGGLMPGSLILLAGEPGAGKSTLSLQMANWFSRNGESTLYFSCEENKHQVFSRANRLNINNKDIFFSRESNLENIIATAKDSPANLIIMDSISMMYSDDITGSSGGVAQVKHITERFMDFAKNSGKSVILIGHVTKDGSVAGPKAFEHMVDVVLYLEGEKHENYRLLRSIKNRFGTTDETGVFKMTEHGFEDVKNIGSEFLSHHAGMIPGSSFGITYEGSRPLLIEVESLTAESKFGYPKVSAQGIPQRKTDQIIAIIGRFLKTEAESYDVYTKIAHGFTVDEPGIDLTVIASVYSAMKKKVLGRVAFVGEVSLTGIVKPISHLKKRIDESFKLGLTKIVVPKTELDISAYKGKVIEIEYIKDLPDIILKL